MLDLFSNPRKSTECGALPPVSLTLNIPPTRKCFLQCLPPKASDHSPHLCPSLAFHPTLTPEAGGELLEAKLI